MSPEALELARRRVNLEIHALSAAFRRAVADKGAEFGARGMAHSSMVVAAIHELCSKELRLRALTAWEIGRRLLDADGALPDDDTRTEVLSVITSAITTESGDLDVALAQYKARMSGEGGTLDGARKAAELLATSDLDIDLLQRRRRLLPHGDVLRAPRYAAALEHWTNARALAEGTEANTIAGFREGILAVEALARIVTPGGGATLGDCIKSLRAKRLTDAGTDKILEGLWTYANAVPGARHGNAIVADLAGQDWQVIKPMLEGAIALLLSIDVVV